MLNKVFSCVCDLNFTVMLHQYILMVRVKALNNECLLS